MKHSKIGASSAERWLACAGSVQHLIDNPMPESKAASEGTRVHEGCEEVLRYRLQHGIEVKGAIEELLLEDFSEHDKESIRMYVDHVWGVYTTRLQEGYDAELRVEFRVHLKSVHEDAFGTVDAAVICHKGPLDVFDYKNGHKAVDAEGNKQQLYYTIGVQEEFVDEDWFFSEIYNHIVQPNNGGIKTSEVSHADLEEYWQELKAGADRVYAENPPRTVGTGCDKFCNRAQCPEYKAAFEKANPLEFSPIEEPDIEIDASEAEGLSVDQLSDLLKAEEMIKGMAADARSILKDRGMRGESTGDYKLIRSLGNYKLTTDVKDLAKLLKLPQADLVESKAKSKAAIEKIIKAKFKDKLSKATKLEILLENCTRPEGEIKLVHKDKKGEPYSPITFEQLD